MLLLLILLLLVLGIALTLPVVQTKIAHYVTEKLNEQYKTDIQVDQIAVTIFGVVKLKKVLIKDHHKDTLIYANRINTNVLDLSKLTAKYDGIICGFCIPYLTQEECKQLFFDCSNLVSQGGVFYISLIEGSYANSKLETSSDGIHSMRVYYYEETWLEKALLDVNFEIFQSMRIPYLRSTGITESHLILLAKRS